MLCIHLLFLKGSKLDSTLQLVFFGDAIDHLSRLCRIFRQPRGNALLIGMEGSGRKALTKLAAHMSNCKCYQIEVFKVA